MEGKRRKERFLKVMVRGGGAQSAWLIECSAYRSGSEWGCGYTSRWLCASVCRGRVCVCGVPGCNLCVCLPRPSTSGAWLLL